MTPRCRWCNQPLEFVMDKEGYFFSLCVYCDLDGWLPRRSSSGRMDNPSTGGEEEPVTEPGEGDEVEIAAGRGSVWC